VFSLKQCLVVNINTGDVVLRGKQHKNVYKVSILSLPQNHLTCSNILDVMLWHQSLGYAIFMLVSKRILCVEESVHMLFDKTNSLNENDVQDEHRMKNMNWTLQEKTCCSCMRKVSLL